MGERFSSGSVQSNKSLSGESFINTVTGWHYLKVDIDPVDLINTLSYAFHGDFITEN